MDRRVSITDRIRSTYASLRPSEREVADYVPENLDRLNGLSVMTAAENTGVSQPTVIRFARALGFKGYREFKHAVFLERTGGAAEPRFDALAGFDLKLWDTIAEIPLKAVQVTKSLLDDTLKSVSAEEFGKAARLLVGARLIDIYCVENSVTPASDLLNKLSYLGLACRLNSDSYLQQISAGHLGPQDVGIAFSYSGCSVDTIKALRQARSAGAATIAVTNFQNAQIAREADVCILAGSGRDVIYGNAIFSRITQLAVVDMLYMGVILSDYQRFSQALDRSGSMIADRGFPSV